MKILAALLLVACWTGSSQTREVVRSSSRRHYDVGCWSASFHEKRVDADYSLIEQSILQCVSDWGGEFWFCRAYVFESALSQLQLWIDGWIQACDPRRAEDM